ncbi:hypothetical protein llap_1029 [Limosa lapponica baueri]|uniref:Uncharacterized protein n=1 Tax=Limosa lapponica baueri TaxID=1758121 RepID=A0A2I0URM3_LIMLA|nr:hypothetical protein llap_1029 [Limosa lapponica baueri]
MSSFLGLDKGRMYNKEWSIIAIDVSVLSTADSETNTWRDARIEINGSRIDIFPFIEIRAWKSLAELLNLISWGKEEH